MIPTFCLNRRTIERFFLTSLETVIVSPFLLSRQNKKCKILCFFSFRAVNMSLAMDQYGQDISGGFLVVGVMTISPATGDTTVCVTHFTHSSCNNNIRDFIQSSMSRIPVTVRDHAQATSLFDDRNKCDALTCRSFHVDRRLSAQGSAVSREGYEFLWTGHRLLTAGAAFPV